MIMITVMIRDMLELFTQYCCYCHFSLWLNGKISYLVARKVFLTSNLPSKEVSKKSIYIAYHRETSNALNASVRCKRKRLQRLSETGPANNYNRIPQAVRQGIPNQWSSHAEGPSAIKAESVARYDQELVGMIGLCELLSSVVPFSHG